MRFLTAAILIPLAVFMVWVGGHAYSALIGVTVILLIFEWARIVDGIQFSRGFYTLSAAALGSILLASAGQYEWAIGVGILGGVVATAISYKRGAPLNVWPFLGALYIILPVIAVMFIRHQPAEGRALSFLLFAGVWATDSGAFLVGSVVGGPKLWPALSPAKTWSGAIGGMSCGAVSVLVLGLLLGIELSVMTLICAGVIIALASVLGDLMESALKRTHGIKDTSGFIPGHGGVLDRLDGFLMAALALALFIILGQIV